MSENPRDADGAFPPTIQQGQPDDRYPPTVQQGRSRDDAFPPTIQQGARRSANGVFPSTIGQAFPRTDQTPGTIPGELLRDYAPVEFLGAGSEGEVWLVRRRTDDQELALKLYQPLGEEQAETCEATIRQLRGRSFRRHAPEISDSGVIPLTRGRQVWVLMEYFRHGTLAALIRAESTASGGVATERAKEIVIELAEAIRFWQQTIRMNPLDLKPANFMVRRVRPVRLVISDFGGAVRMTISQQFGRVLTTLAYMPPEGLAEYRSEPWPWWALGEIAYELIGGHPRFHLADLSPAVIDQMLRTDRAIGRPDLSRIQQDRWRLLIAGLLTREPEYRWTYGQVMDWAQGGNPPIMAGASRVRGPAKAPIVFADRDYHEPRDLAAAMVDRPGPAARWLAGTGRDELLSWLDSEPRDTLFPRQYLRGAGAEARAHRVVTAFGTTYLRDEPPSYRGSRVDADGLLQLVRGGRDGAQLLAEILREDILPIAARSACAHPGCRDRCALLVQVAAEVPDIAGGVEQAIARAGRQVSAAGEGAAWTELSSAERDTIRALAVELTLRPEHKDAILQATAKARGSRPDWWRDVQATARRADPGTVDGRTAVITAAMLPTRAASVAGARQSREEQARRERRNQADQARRARESRRRGTDKGWFWAFAVLVVTVAAPWAIGHFWWRTRLISVSVAPPPDPRALPGGPGSPAFLPEFVFGVLVLAGVLGLIFVRPPWTRGRIGFVLAGTALAIVSLAAPRAANGIADKLNQTGMNTYRTGPIPVSDMGTNCGSEYWTSNNPVNGSYRRYAVVDDASGNCTELVGYFGWAHKWTVIPAGDQSFTALGWYPDNLLVAATQNENGSGVELLGVDGMTGKVTWHWTCPDGEQIANVVFHGINDHSQYSDDSKYVDLDCQDNNGNSKDVHVVPPGQGQD